MRKGDHDFVWLSALRVKACRYCGIVEDGWNINGKCPKQIGINTEGVQDAEAAKRRD